MICSAVTRLCMYVCHQFSDLFDKILRVQYTCIEAKQEKKTNI